MRDLFGSMASGLRRLTNDAPVPFTSAQGGLFSQTFDPALADGQRAYDAHGAVGTLFAITNQISTTFSTVEWHLYQRTSVRDKSRRKEILNHGFLDVWNMPNPFYTGQMFRETVQLHLDLIGEGMIVLNKFGSVIYEMWPVRPDRMQPVKHPTKYLTGWIYNGPEGEQVPLTLDQVIQIKYPNPGDPYRGRGPVQTILSDVDAARYSAEWNRNFFINGARPGGIITVDHRMSDEEFRSFTNRWRMQHQGVANAHRVAILENAQWQDTNFSMTDMQFVELRNLPRELIREAFAFPKPMLGTVDDVNRANAEAAKEIMAEGQTVPRLKRWKDVVNTFLLPQFALGASLILDFDDPTPINTDTENNARNSMSIAASNLVKAGYHPDDVSEAMGLPPMRWIGVPTTSSVTASTDDPNSIPSEGGDDVQNTARFARR
ncbi:MAG TPA: phage portal protein [Candidatus Eisenbacteria bacterium]|nr:phage portal protein [Candidatus Eisenbacteria bacterium]